MPWQGHTTNMIDRFDGRALLDIIPVYEETHRKKSDKEAQLEGELNFERYYPLIECSRMKVDPPTWVAQVADALLTTPSPTALAARALPELARSSPAKQRGEYSSVGYSYEEGHSAGEDSGDSDGDDEGGVNDQQQLQPQSPAPNQKPVVLSSTDGTHDLAYAWKMDPVEERELNEAARMLYGIDEYCRLARLAHNDRELMQKQKEEELARRAAGRKPSRKDRGERHGRKEEGEDQRHTAEDMRLQRRSSPTRGRPRLSVELARRGGTPKKTGTAQAQKEGSEQGECQFITEFAVESRRDSDQEGASPPSSPLAEASDTIETPSRLVNARNPPVDDDSRAKVAVGLTPQERLKLKMRTQLTKTIRRDHVTTERKREEAEQERRYRDLEMKHLRKKFEGQHPGSSRSPSYSPTRRRDSRSRSRSHSRGSSYGRRSSSLSRSPSSKRRRAHSSSHSPLRSRSRSRSISTSHSPPRRNRRRRSSESRSDDSVSYRRKRRRRSSCSSTRDARRDRFVGSRRRSSRRSQRGRSSSPSSAERRRGCRNSSRYIRRRSRSPRRLRR